jgi:hypothetical protein
MIDAEVDEIVFDGGRAIGVIAEVTDFADIERMRLWVEEDLGPVEVLAAFAASGGPLPGQTIGCPGADDFDLASVVALYRLPSQI